MGDQIIIAGVERGFLKDRVDIFALTDPQSLLILRTIPGVAQKKVVQLVNELTQAKKRSLARFLYALGISFVGKKAAQDISDYMAVRSPKTIEERLSYLQDEEALHAIRGVGKQTVHSLKNFMTDAENQERFTRASSLGVDTFFRWEAEGGSGEAEKQADQGLDKADQNSQT